MNFTAAQIEDIVRVVLQRLQSDVVAPPATQTAPAQRTATEPVKTNPGEVHIADRVVTLETLKGRLDGTQTVVIHPKAVVTPATRDELRSRNIRLVRQLLATRTLSTRAAPLLLVTTSAQLLVLGKRVCSQQAQSLAGTNDIATLAAIEKHLSSGGVGAVWCSDTPFAAIAATFGKAHLRAIQLSDLRSLSPAIEQARPNVIVVDRQSWREAAVANLIRNWFRSLG